MTLNYMHNRCVVPDYINPIIINVCHHIKIVDNSSFKPDHFRVVIFK